MTSELRSSTPASPSRTGQGLHADDLARGQRILFAATGISDSAMLPGIRYEDTHAITHSILMRAKHQTIRYIKTVHNLDLKTVRLRSDASDHSL
jgi:fructose-1,6-bisphosphatase II